MNWPILIACIVVSFLPGLIGAAFMRNSPKEKWYLENKPAITPPAYVFPIVWNLLYAILGVVLYMVYMSKSPNRGFLLILLAMNLVLNLMWSIFFFAMRWYGLAYVNILMMVLVTSLVIFHCASWHAQWMMMPYLIWLGFASTLNLHFVLLQWNGKIA